MVGHYGTTGLFAGGLAIVLLVIHLAVPFGFSDLPDNLNDAGIDDESLSRSDAADRMDLLQEGYGLASPGLTLTGAILAVVGGLLLIVFGFLPVPVNAARFMGWSAGILGAMGGWFAFSSSLFAVGTGFTTFLGVIAQNPHEGVRLWIISPVLTAALGLTLVMFFGKVIANVVTTKGELRTNAKRILRGPTLAAFFLIVVLVMPWAFMVQDGAERRAAGQCPDPNAPCDPATNFYTAWGSTQNGFGGILETAAVTEEGQALWSHLAFSLKVMIAATWVTFFLALIAPLGHIIASVTETGLAPRITGAFQLGNIVTLPWAAVQFVLACTYQWKPSWDETIIPDTQSWWFGFAPLIGAAFLVLWVLQQVHANMGVVSAARDFAAQAQAKPHTFD